MNREIPELKPGSRSTRELVISERKVDQDARTVELAFSSEAPVERWWGSEILDHSSSSMRLDRMQSGGAVLMDHDTRDQVGVVESVQIGADRVARAVVRFGRGARASEVFQDVVDGIRRNVSVGYMVHGVRLESSSDDKDVYRVTDWEPYEVSLVSVPADTSVGVGRSAPTPNPTPKPESITMEQNKDDAAQRQAGTDSERKRAADIIAIADAYKRYGLEDIATAAIRDGMSVDQFRNAAMERMAAAPKPTADIGMTEKETRQYSLTRVIAALANPRDQSAQRAAAFELECSSAAAETFGRKARGVIVPFDVLKRDLNKTTATAGGHTISTNLLTGSFIDMLRNAMVIDRMGATMLTGLVGNIAIPRQTGGATAYWVAESGAATESQQAFDQVTMSPKTVGAFTDISRKLLLQSSIDVEGFVQSDIAKVLGLAIQAAAIKGGGSNEPTGILATSGIGDVAGGTNGLAPTWQHIIDLETDVSVANADIGTLGYLTNAKVRGKLKTTSKVSGQNGFIWEPGNTPLNGYQTGVTNAVPSNLDKGATTGVGVCSAIIFGNFADLILGMWGGLDILVDPFTGGAAGTVRVIAHQDVDVAVRHAESFSAMLDALTT